MYIENTFTSRDYLNYYSIFILYIRIQIYSFDIKFTNAVSCKIVLFNIRKFLLGRLTFIKRFGFHRVEWFIVVIFIFKKRMISTQSNRSRILLIDDTKQLERARPSYIFR